MKRKAKFKSDAFEAIQSAAMGLHRAGTIDKATMREFDESRLTELGKDICAGKNVHPLPDDLVSSMRAYSDEEVDLDEPIEGEVAI